MISLDLKKIRYTAAEILAAAVFETFPNVHLLDGALSPSGFYYDFIFPHPIHPELHAQIEERIRQIVREKREIQTLEMVAISAKGFLKSRGHSNKAFSIDGPGLFSLVKVGEFVDLGTGVYLENTKELEHFKLFPPLSLGEKQIRFLGTAFATKSELREFTKLWNTYSIKRHEKRGESKHFWKSFEEGTVFLPDGILERDELTLKLKKNLFPFATEVSCPTSYRMDVNLLSKLDVNAVFEIVSETISNDSVEDVGFLDSRDRRVLRATYLLKETNSLLQSIEKTLTILGFDFTLFLTCSKRGGGVLEKNLIELGRPYEISGEIASQPQLDFLVTDGLGRRWSAACVSANKHLSVQVIVERNLALLIYRMG